MCLECGMPLVNRNNYDKGFCNQNCKKYYEESLREIIRERNGGGNLGY